LKNAQASLPVPRRNPRHLASNTLWSANNRPARGGEARPADEGRRADLRGRALSEDDKGAGL